MTSAPANVPTVVLLTAAGAAAFWLANLVISWTPAAADYRTANGISYGLMLIEALAGGFLIAGCVGAALVRRRRNRLRSPMREAMLLAIVALVMVTVLVEVPTKLLGSSARPWHELLVASAINAIRIPALGLAIGSAARRLLSSPAPRRADPHANSARERSDVS